MNRTTYLLMKIAEEAAEVAHMASKTAQLGTADRYQGGPTNLERLSDELRQLTTVCAMLSDRLQETTDESFGFGKTISVGQYDPEKTHRVDHYYEIATVARATGAAARASEPEPFDALNWAAENVSSACVGDRGRSDLTRWWVDVDADGAAYIDIKHDGKAYRVSLADWIKARRFKVR